MLFVCEPHYDQAWIVNESESRGSPSSHACLRAFVHNRGVFGSTSCQEWCGDQTCRFGSARTHRKSRMTRCDAPEDDVESHQGHGRFRQRIDGHDSQRMLERRQRDDSIQRFCSSTMGIGSNKFCIREDLAKEKMVFCKESNVELKKSSIQCPSCLHNVFEATLPCKCGKLIKPDQDAMNRIKEAFEILKAPYYRTSPISKKK